MMGLLSKELLKYVPAQVVPALVAIISIPILTRILSPEEYGQYALVLLTVVMMTTLLAWLDVSIVRFHPALSEQEAATLVRTAFWTKLVLTAVLAAVAYTVTLSVSAGGARLEGLVGAGVVVLASKSIFEILANTLRARLRGGAYSLFLICSKIAGLTFGVLLAAGLALGSGGILWGVALGFGVTLPFLWKMAFANVPPFGSLSSSWLRQSASYGIPLTVSSIGTWVLSQSDRYFIELFHGARAVGVYSAAYWISENSVMSVSLLLVLSASPLLIDTWEKRGESATRQLLTSVARVNLLSAIPMVVGLSYLADTAMHVLTGKQFAEGYIVVPWVTAGAFFLGLQHRYQIPLILNGQSGRIMLVTLLSAMLNVGSNWILIPIYGYQVAGITTLISYLVMFVLMVLSSKRYFAWPFPWSTLLRISVAVVAMLVVLLATDHLLHWQGMLKLMSYPVIGGVVYLSMLAIIGEFSRGELSIVVQLVQHAWASRRFFMTSRSR